MQTLTLIFDKILTNNDGNMWMYYRDANNINYCAIGVSKFYKNYSRKRQSELGEILRYHNEYGRFFALFLCKLRIASLLLFSSNVSLRSPVRKLSRRLQVFPQVTQGHLL